MSCAQPGARLLAQLGIEIGQRLVEQDDGRLVNQCARDRDALLLAAGKLMRVARGKMGEPDLCERLLDARLDLGRARRRAASGRRRRCRTRCGAATARRTGTQGRGRAASGGQFDLARGVEEDACRRCAIEPAVRRLEPGDRAQQRGLAAAGRPEQRHHLARRHA